MLNIVTVNYNTPELVEALIMSINKHTANANIIVFDNSDKEKFINNKFDNVIVIDNTKHEYINFIDILKNYDRKNTTSNFGSAKHSLSIDYIMKNLYNKFILIDSDCIVKKDLNEIVDDNYGCCCFIEKYCHGELRVCPYLCYINYEKISKYQLSFCDLNRLCETNPNYIGDTGTSFYEDLQKNNIPIKNIDIYIYIYISFR